jgi:hypothetical protein
MGRGVRGYSSATSQRPRFPVASETPTHHRTCWNLARLRCSPGRIPWIFSPVRTLISSSSARISARECRVSLDRHSFINAPSAIITETAFIPPWRMLRPSLDSETTWTSCVPPVRQRVSHAQAHSRRRLLKTREKKSWREITSGCQG